MARTALLVANSVSAQHTQERTAPTLVRWTADQVANTLNGLPSKYSFRCSSIIDESPAKVRRSVDVAAEDAARTRDLLLIYYFGHGRIENDELVFVHPGKGKNETSPLPFQAILRQVQVHRPPRVLFILDCCYAGAATKRFESDDYCLLACTTPTTRAFFEEDTGRPIGVFTRALIDGITSQAATESITSDEISVKSLFDYSKKATAEMTSNAQEPYMIGAGDEVFTIWTDAPSLVKGISEAPEKSGYAKLLAILQTMKNRSFRDVGHLYEVVLLRHTSHFLTAYKLDDGRIGERPAHWTSLRRYISFLRTLGIVDSDRIELTESGMKLLHELETNYNSHLLVLLERFLSRHRLSRDAIRKSMQDLMQRRALPTMRNIVTDLGVITRNTINHGHLGLTLQILGYMGAIGMPKSREQVFFPWTSTSGRNSFE